jgi:signal transduction histidine kinase/ActR/RegA family two-component response regulator
MTQGTAASNTLGSIETRLALELAQRHRAEALLEGARQRLRLALEASRMCMLDYDIAQDRLEFSAEPGAVAGMALQPFSGSLSEMLSHVHADDRPRVERSIHEALESGRELELEARIVLRPSRRTLWLLAKAVVERDEHGRAVRVTGVARDNTRRKEGEVVRLAQAQGERLRALGEMASGIAHDLNQSLALITGYSDMARQELGLDTPDLQRVREMVEITGQAAIEGGHALRGLLSFVRNQELMAEAERVDVAELLHDVARLTAPRWRDEPQAEGRPIQFTVDADADCAIDGAPAALREAITNLIFNAVDAMPRGGTIHLTARRTEEHVVVEIGDSGTGIPGDILSRIFDPFFTTKGERGTGLGLPQVLGIVERHNGTIDVESHPERGTTFKLTFPASRETVVRGEKPPSVRPAPAPKRAIRVLVVEDEQQLARMACLVLTQRGHRAIAAASGDEALAQLEVQRFDLVISDLGLGPGKNGWDLAEAVRERWADTRFVLVTGWGAAIDVAEARARGVDRVIPKPYRIADLRQVADDVAAALDNG